MREWTEEEYQNEASITLEDKFQILDLISNYGYFFDQGEIESFLELFTDNVILESYGPDQNPKGSNSGKKEVRKWCEDLKTQYEQNKHQSQYRHFQINTVLNPISDDCVKGRTYFFVSVQHEGRSKLDVILSGVYEDKFQRISSGWRFSYRGIHFD